jgi:hypothetical protein
MKPRTRMLMAVGMWCWIFAVGGVPTAAARSGHVCDEICGSGSACDAECWLSQFDYDQDYPSTTCGAEGFECCGDGLCNPSTEGCNACPDDCGYVSCPPPPGECGLLVPCPSDKVCNAEHKCVPPVPEESGAHSPTCGGPCTDKSQCCSVDVCVAFPGQQGYCAIPGNSYCPESFPCSGWLGPYSYDNCQLPEAYFGCSIGLRDMYCDPGIDRCMFNQGFDCPEDSTLSVCRST